MSLQTRAEFAKRHALFYGEISSMRHCGIAHRTNVAIGEKQPIPLLPIRIFRIVLQDMKVERGKNVGHAKRARGVPRLCFGEHLNDRSTNEICFLFDFFYFFIGYGHTQAAILMRLSPVSSSGSRIKGCVTSQRQTSSASATTTARRCPPMHSSDSSQRERTAWACTTGSSSSISEMLPSMLATSKGPSSEQKTYERFGRS